MPKVSLTFACGLYDRMLALYTGEVQPEGIDLNFLAIDDPRQIFDRMGKNLEFDACEMSSSEVFSRHASGRTEMVALPVFPSRVFRHGFITVNRKAVKTPKDLEGKRIGVPLYTQTAAVFIRGMLRDEYGVDLSGVHWVQGATNSAEPHGNPSPPPLLKPVSIEQNRSGRSLSELLEAGEIQAILGSGLPDSLAHQFRRRAAVPGLPPGGARLLQAHAHLPDHASRRHAPRCLREASVHCHQPLSGDGQGQEHRAREDARTSARCATCCLECRPSST